MQTFEITGVKGLKKVPVGGFVKHQWDEISEGWKRDDWVSRVNAVKRWKGWNEPYLPLRAINHWEETRDLK